MTDEQLLDDFGYYFSHTGYVNRLRSAGRPVRWPKMTKERREALQEMRRWCAERDFDPRLYLYSLFQARNWAYPPQWAHLVPKTKKTEKKVVERYYALTDTPLYQKRMDQLIRHSQSGAGVVFDPNRDISASAEAAKRQYLDLDDTAGCMSAIASRTYGFHPRSLVCARCPSALECQRRLQAMVPFDIVALRRGEITVEQARFSSAQTGSHGRN